MAGSQDPSDNPMAINVVPLVDIIFCLCVFFMCSFKFRQLEGKFDSWLPRDKGAEGLPSLEMISEVRVALMWDEATQTMTRQMGVRKIPDDNDLQKSIKEAHDAKVAQGKPDAPVTIDADSRIPWNEVITVVNLIKRCDIDKIEFAMGAAPKKPGAK